MFNCFDISCALTLMQKGADINVDIIDNPDGDKPPVEAAPSGDDLTYTAKGRLQRVSTIERTIWKNIKVSKKKPIKWLARHYKPAWKPKPRGYPVFQVHIMNDAFLVMFS